jgi:tetraacyldisaccharide 4'-kinase
VRRTLAERLVASWATDGVVARVLAPLGTAYGAMMMARNAAFRRGLRRVTPPSVPTISIGNLTVGGTGKTPVSAWVAERLASRGQRPGIVLRGYGADEPLVHRALVPSAVVIADPDRVRGAAQAVAAGATAIVLDDAFQHRRAGRTVDLVLVAAEQGMARRCLPAGPLREPWSGVARADALIVTRKTVSSEAAQTFADALVARWGRPVAVMHLAPGGLRRVDGTHPAPPGPGARLLAVSGIGEPGAFHGQLEAAGYTVTPMPFPDHHAFTAVDVSRLLVRAVAVDAVVCTLKDAVKLAPVWPAGAPPLWYLSQVVRLDAGQALLDGLLDRLDSLRHS